MSLKKQRYTFVQDHVRRTRAAMEACQLLVEVNEILGGGYFCDLSDRDKCRYEKKLKSAINLAYWAMPIGD